MLHTVFMISVMDQHEEECLRVWFHKRKHDSEFVLSSIKAFKGTLCSFKKIIHTSYE